MRLELILSVPNRFMLDRCATTYSTFDINLMLDFTTTGSCHATYVKPVQTFSFWPMVFKAQSDVT